MNSKRILTEGLLIVWFGIAWAGGAAGQTPSVAEPAAQSAGSAVVVILQDGSSFEVDELREESGRYIYRMGSMQGFLERAEVSAVRQAAASEAAGAGPLALGFTTGHRGLDRLIVEVGAAHQLDPLLIYLVMREESGFNYRAVSRVGARGLMQLMPATARRLGIRNIDNPRENVEAGTRYLRGLIESFGGDVNLALAAYNAGEAAVRRHGWRIPPYPETRRYVWRINTAYRKMKAE
ncbi:MAG: lytic transglycosylase domain-containing protein [Acidobacteriota bacterium]